MRSRGERVSRVLLVDGDGKVAAGKALDIQQSGAVDRFHVRLEGTDDVAVWPAAPCASSPTVSAALRRNGKATKAWRCWAAGVVRRRCADRVCGRIAGRMLHALAHEARPPRAARGLVTEALIAACERWSRWKRAVRRRRSSSPRSERLPQDLSCRGARHRLADTVSSACYPRSMTRIEARRRVCGHQGRSRWGSPQRAARPWFSTHGAHSAC